MHLLFIDYDSNGLKVMQHVFELWGYEVTICATQSQLINILDGNTFDAIITELNIPGSSPGEIISLLRQKQSDTPIIVLTENHSVKSAIQAIKDGANDVLQKPIDLEHLRNILSVLINSPN